LCDILLPMNPWRDLQRLYIVLTVAWIAAILAVVPSFRIKFWSIQVPKGVLSAQMYDPVRNALNSFQFYILFHVLPNPSLNSRLQKFAWLASSLILLPAAGYAILFCFVPWIYRGLGLAKQI
jgi:hypothetical protein